MDKSVITQCYLKAQTQQSTVLKVTLCTALLHAGEKKKQLAVFINYTQHDKLANVTQYYNS